MLRPGFLPTTAIAYLLGLACAAHAHALRAGWPLLLAGMAVALAAHAAANALNDYEDHRNGADAGNRGAIAPFTGGAGLIQRGEATPAGTRRLALALAMACVVAGLAIALQSTPALLGIGALGLLVGWAYSSPPLALMSRGLGEPAIALAWTLVVVGGDTLARGALSLLGLLLGLCYGLLVAGILLVNSFPDAAAGKASLRVRLGASAAARLFLACQVGAHLLSALLAWRWSQPQWLLAQASLPLGLWAGAMLWRHRHAPAALRPAIIATITTALLHGGLLALVLALG